MPVEASVAQISDLNPAWPLGSDTGNYGPDHLREIKTAVQSLRDGTHGLLQIGVAVAEFTLTADTTITYSGFSQLGGRLAVIIKQDATGGWKASWDTAFKLTPTDISYEPNTYSVFEFVVGADGNYYLCANPVIGAV